MKNTLIVLGITAVVLVVLGFGIYQVMQSPPGQKTLSQQVGASDHILGDPTTAKVALVEYGDFQCPACGYYYPIVKKLTHDYGSKMILVFRNFPLSQHPNAIPAAEAAEAASKKGKYWEMFDMIYSHQQDWQDSTTAAAIFQGYAQQLGLNPDQFKKDAASGDVTTKIQNDQATGLSSNVDSTPSFFLNGTYIQPSGYDDFKKIIDQTISQ